MASKESNFPSRKDIVKAGYLTASHSARGRWRRRWCVLTDSSLLGSRRKNLGYARLLYYKSEHEADTLAKPQGIVDLYACVALQPRGPPVAGHSMVFDLTTDDNHTYHFSASSFDDKQEWVDSLRKYVTPSNPEPLHWMHKSRPISEYTESVNSVKPKLPKKSHSTRLSHSVAGRNVHSTDGIRNRRGSEDLDLELGSLKSQSNTASGKTIEAVEPTNLKILDYLDVDFSHMPATNTDSTPHSDRVIYTETRPLPKIPSVTNLDPHPYSAVDIPGFNPQEFDGYAYPGVEQLFEELRLSNLQVERKAGFLEPASDQITLCCQIKLCNIPEIPIEQISYTNISETRGTCIWKEVRAPGKARVLPVAIKRAHHSVELILQEAVIIGQLRHTNIITLFGIVTLKQPLLVMEVLHKGDLKSHLQTLKLQIEESVYENAQFQLIKELCQRLLRYTEDIALGLSYLASVGFVHNKLMARAIMMTDKDVCKIADFDRHFKQAPVQWCAPEAHNFQQYSTASDVWSFAVVMYEIWSLGHSPFKKFTDEEVVGLVDEGYRLPPPPGVAVEVYNLMIHCWNPEPSSRPNCIAILSSLSAAEASVKCSALYTVEGTVLGGPLESAENVHKGLQQMYLKKPLCQLIPNAKIPQHQDGCAVVEKVVTNCPRKDESTTIKPSHNAQMHEEYERIQHCDLTPQLLARLQTESQQNTQDKEKAQQNEGQYESIQTYEKIQHCDLSSELLARLEGHNKAKNSAETSQYESVQIYERIQHNDLSPEQLATLESESHNTESEAKRQQNGDETSHYESVQTYERIQHSDLSPEMIPKLQETTKNMQHTDLMLQERQSEAPRVEMNKGGTSELNGGVCYYESVQTYEKMRHCDLDMEMPTRLQTPSQDSKPENRKEKEERREQSQDGGHYEHCDLSPQFLASFQTVSHKAVQDSNTIEEVRHCEQHPPLKQCDQNLELSVH